MKLTPESMAIMLRAALRQISELSDNTNFYDDNNGTSFPIQETFEALNKEFPEFTEYERKFIQAVSDATGLSGIEKFVLHRRDRSADYGKLENGTTFMDHSITFDRGFAFGQEIAERGEKWA